MAPLTVLLKSRVTVVWSGLVIATLISWGIGTDGSLGAHLATTVVLLVAFAKVRFIGLWFMELRDAPRALRTIFEGYCVTVCAALVVIYLLG